MNNTILQQPYSQWLPIEWYPSYERGLPDLCVGHFPPWMGNFSHRIWIVENSIERERLLAELEKPPIISGNSINLKDGPDKAISKPGSGDMFLALYAPRDPDWPWITIGRFPLEVGRQIGGLAREVYTTETDIGEIEARERIEKLRKLNPFTPVFFPK